MKPSVPEDPQFVARLRKEAERCAPLPALEPLAVSGAARRRLRRYRIATTSVAVVCAVGLAAGAQALSSWRENPVVPALPDSVRTNLTAFDISLLAVPNGWDSSGLMAQPENEAWTQRSAGDGCGASTFLGLEPADVEDSSEFTNQDVTASTDELLASLAARDGAAAGAPSDAEFYAAQESLVEGNPRPIYEARVAEWTVEGADGTMSVRVLARSELLPHVEEDDGKFVATPLRHSLALRLECPEGNLDEAAWSALVDAARPGFSSEPVLE